MIQGIIEHPADILKTRCVEVVDFDESLHKLLRNMVDTMRYYNGVGLAAPQVGVLKRAFVAVIDRKVEIIVNPLILSQSEQRSTMQEGCLSIPNYYAMISRPKKIVLECYDEFGDMKHYSLAGVGSHIVQHEIDHLNGKLITDY